mmetsp:Transcript_19707/g.29242  ORF Transcript_19707/g.29242 Transcript_19707/m.29242 type:complete len:383 (-) Transcript_19707:2117-3265(-)|eukprot:CAMPEP_0194214208 /NCGR_PEP_ID=MMETSP0156-20130528/15337_1 /TAXON_ID=33649 /ORGANISM="Thalassionema nitzschioides, Strain L26-B" /LENGTH=382 /DNA_ID=CAMNT_0038942427 /DNA_START=74 /DNA_END=1222 /DNA_ORIENTATION=+
MTSTEETASRFQCVIKLAPFSKSTKKEDDHLNSETAFRITIDANEGNQLTVASALRSFLEESCCSCFLPRVCNRVLKDEKGDTAVEVNYGDGYKTYVKSQDTSAVKSVKQIGVFLHMGELDKESTHSQIIVSPTDYLFNHVESKMREKKKLGDDTPLVLSIFTGCLLFHSPKFPSREASIQLNVPPNKLGYYTNGVFDGERQPYPTKLVEASTKNNTKKATKEKKDVKETPYKKSKPSSSSSEEQKKSDSGTKSSEKKTPVKRKRTKKHTPKATKEKEKGDPEESPPRKKSTSKDSPTSLPVSPAGNGKAQKKAVDVQDANENSEKPSKQPEGKTSAPKKSSSSAKKIKARSAKKPPIKRTTSARKVKAKTPSRPTRKKSTK